MITDEYRDHIQKLASEGRKLTEIASSLEDLGVRTTRHSIRRALSRWEKLSKAPKTLQDSNIDLDNLVREQGLDPAEWDVTHVRVNQWGRDNENKQMRASLSRKAQSLVLPAKPASPTKLKYNHQKLDERLAVIVSDHQAPFHDEDLHQCTLEFLGHNQPAQIVVAGDLLDFPNISRYDGNPEWSARTQECIDAGHRILADYRAAAPTAEIIYLKGNHEERLRRAIINKVPDIYRITQANIHDTVLGLPHLLRLDDLDIDFIVPYGSYEHAQFNLSDKLSVIHGYIARKHSGQTALETLNHFGNSVIMGHGHRQAIVFQTKFDSDGEPEMLTAVEAGCMCQIEGGLGFTFRPNWQPGFATATIFKDGTFKIDLATFVKSQSNSQLLWRNQRYAISV